MAILLDNPLEVARDHYLMKFDPAGFGGSLPGQFVNVRASAFTDPLVRRPFSVFDRSDSSLELIIKRVGPATRALCRSEKGEHVDILGPLGNGFSIVEGGTALLVGGGVGNAPLHYLARRLRGAGTRVVYLYGARTRELIYLRTGYGALCDELHITTDDGSEGSKGAVTSAAGDFARSGRFDRIYACGPVAMMSALVTMLRDTATPVEVSLETYFGCGIGLCTGCTVETVEGNKRACVDGPVMDGRLILWERLMEG